MSDASGVSRKELRRRAESYLEKNPDALEGLELGQIKNIIHDLKVHQVELELQNEELRQAQTQLEESKKKFSRLYNNAPFGYLTLDSSATVIQSNQTLVDMLQTDLGKILNHSLTDFIHPDDRQEFRARFRAFFRKPAGKIIECRMLAGEGPTFFASLKGRLEEFADLPTGAKNREVLFVVVIDISEKRKALLDLEQQTLFLESLMAAIPSPVFYADNRGRYLGCNKAFEDFIGVKRDQLFSLPSSSLNLDLPRPTSGKGNIGSAGLSAENPVEKSIKDADGVWREVLVYRSEFSDAGGRPAGSVGVLLDITERKKAEKEIANKAEINAAMAELAEKLLAGAEIEETSFLVLKKAKELTQSPYGFVGYIDQATGVLISPTLSRDIWSECDVPEKSVIFDEFSGLWGWVLKNSRPLMTNNPQEDPRSTGVPLGHIPIENFLSVPVIIDGILVGTIALCNSPDAYSDEDLAVVTRLASIFGLAIQKMRTVQDLRLAKDAAETANVAKSNFLATMSHEIRTPMNAILGFTDMTLDSQLDTQQRENLEIVVSSAKHLMNLLNDILDLSKIEAGRIELDFRPFDLPELILDAIKSFSLRAQNKDIDFRHDIPADLPQNVIGDRHRLYQILFNLLSNAIKFTEKGSVSVTVQTEDTTQETVETHFVVEDTGIGIPQEKQLVIFDPFTQADSSTTRRFGGTGLGLAICNRLVSEMGGNIWVESELGQGSRFHFTIPFQISASKSAGPISIKTESEAGRPDPADDSTPIVLLVEDNPVNQKLVSALIKKKGYQVVTAGDGLEAVEIYAREKIDIILMDIEMPGMNGLDATRAIRAKEAQLGRRTPIIAMTAHAMKGHKETFIKEGMDDYISKPIDQASLFSLIDQLFRNKKSEEHS